MIRPIHIVILLVVILLLFGAKKLPEIAGSMGKSMKVFKKEVREMREEEDAYNGSTSATQLPPSQNHGQQAYGAQGQPPYGQGAPQYAQPGASFNGAPQQPYQQPVGDAYQPGNPMDVPTAHPQDPTVQQNRGGGPADAAR